MNRYIEQKDLWVSRPTAVAEINIALAAKHAQPPGRNFPLGKANGEGNTVSPFAYAGIFIETGGPLKAGRLITLGIQCGF
ncbi:MAG: hypothetical protein R3B47_11140 [Bacteroidia bacterium]